MDVDDQVPESREHPAARERLADLAAKHLPMLRRFVRSHASATLRAREPVADIVQSSVREVVQAAKRCAFDDEAAFLSYLRTVAAHKIVSKSRYHEADRRNAKREATPSRACAALPRATDSARAPSPSRCLERAEELAQMRAAFGTLSVEDRRIVTMRRIEGVSTQRIAEELGLSESTVRWRIARALAQLACKLGEPGIRAQQRD